jgi:hypothetical protein
MASTLGDYTYTQLVELLDSDEPPPTPLTRKEIREAVQHLDREAAATKVHELERELDETERKLNTLRYAAFMEERRLLSKYILPCRMCVGHC